MKGTVLVRMPAEMRSWVDGVAKEKGITTPEFIRTLISREKERMSRPKINPFTKLQERKVTNL